MIIRDIMEEKQLNFNQPLLSVRRFSSTVTSETDKTQHIPSYKSELKSGPVRDAGKVPFIWEKTPGKPKDETKSFTQAVEQPPQVFTPNLPPGRVSKLKQQGSDTEMRTGSTLSMSQKVAALIKELRNHESSLEEKIWVERESSDSDDGDETFLDALDTLSRTESFFMSSSMSGWDGDDDEEVRVQPFGRFSSDRRARDFIIDRFLPAAKAMTSETPQYASFRKPPVGQEQHKKKVENTEKRSPPLDQHRPKSLRYHAQHIEREASEDESDDCNGPENYTTTACGLLPRFCLLNPIPGSRMVDRVQGNFVRGMQTRSTASQIESTKEHAKPHCHGKKLLDSKSDFTREKEMLDILEKSKHGTDPHLSDCSKLLPCSECTQCETSYESPIVEKTLYIDSVCKVKPKTNRGEDDFETFIRDSGISKHPSIDSSLEDSNRLDIANVKAALQSKSSESPDSPFLLCSEKSIKSMQMDMENPSNKIDSEKQSMTKPGNHGSDSDQDLVMTSGFECQKIDWERQVPSREKISGILIQNSEVGLKSQGTAKSIDEKIDLEMESKCLVDSDHTAGDANYFEIPLLLPSLKAPSESWLKRTLPTLSSRNIYSQSNLARSQTPNTASLYPQWEITVKSSNAHHEHMHLHEELLTPIPED